MGGGEDRPGTRYKEEAEAEAGAQLGRLTVPSPAGPRRGPLGLLAPAAGAVGGDPVSLAALALSERPVKSQAGRARRAARGAFSGLVAPWRFPKSTRYGSRSCHATSGLPGGLVEVLLCIPEMSSPKAKVVRVTQEVAGSALENTWTGV